MSSKLFSKLANRERIRNEVLSKSDLIPSLPDTVYRILEILKDPSAEITECEKILRTDATLVARMLKVVNSPLYGRVRKITTIKEAVITLGFKSLRGLVLAASTSRFLQMDFSCYSFAEKGLWFHSLAVAQAAKNLSRILGKAGGETEEIFVAGLLHDIGKILLAPYLTKMDITINYSSSPVIEAEHMYLGINHGEAGVRLAEKWNLGNMVSTVINNHHNDPRDSEFTKEISIVEISDLFAHYLGFGLKEKTPINCSCLERNLEIIGIDQKDWEEDISFELEESMKEALASLANTG